MNNRITLNDNELENVSGGLFDDVDPSYLTAIEEDRIGSCFMRHINYNHSFKVAYEDAFNMFFIIVNNDRAKSGAPAVTETYFKKRCKQIWKDKGGKL